MTGRSSGGVTGRENLKSGGVTHIWEPPSVEAAAAPDAKAAFGAAA